MDNVKNLDGEVFDIIFTISCLAERGSVCLVYSICCFLI